MAQPVHEHVPVDGGGSSVTDLEWLFAELDADSSGYISRLELEMAIDQIFGSVDEKLVDDMLKEADTDGDGEISLEEFKWMMGLAKKHRKVTQALHDKSKRKQRVIRKQDANMFSGAITSDKDICGQIRTALHDRLARVDLFRQVRSRRLPVVSSSEYHPSLSTDPHRALSSARL